MPVTWRTIRGVPILSTGTYTLKSGPKQFTTAELQAAIAAVENDPAIRAPRIGIDQVSASFADPEAHGGEPAFGRVENMRLTASGSTIVGDLVVPAKLADLMEACYPSRSIEGQVDFESATGQKHALVITGLKLLGTDWPGVTTLDDLHELVTAMADDSTDEGLVLASMPAAVLVAAAEPEPVAAPISDPQEDHHMTDEQRRALALSLGLPADTPEDELHTTAAARAADATPTPEPVTPEPVAEVTPEPTPEPVAASAALPPGVRAIDEDTLAQLQASAARADALAASAEEQRRDQAIASAIQAGRIAPGRRGVYVTAWERDPEGTHTLLTASADQGGLPEGLVPVTQRTIEATGEQAPADQGYDPSWLSPAEQARIAAGGATTTIHTEA